MDHIYVYEKKEKKEKNIYIFKFSGEKAKGSKTIYIRKYKKPGKGCSCKLTHPILNTC